MVFAVLVGLWCCVRLVSIKDKDVVITKELILSDWIENGGEPLKAEFVGGPAFWADSGSQSMGNGRYSC
jgi:hypothetical protein